MERLRNEKGQFISNRVRDVIIKVAESVGLKTDDTKSLQSFFLQNKSDFDNLGPKGTGFGTSDAMYINQVSNYIEGANHVTVRNEDGELTRVDREVYLLQLAEFRQFMMSNFNSPIQKMAFDFDIDKNVIAKDLAELQSKIEAMMEDGAEMEEIIEFLEDEGISATVSDTKK